MLTDYKSYREIARIIRKSDHVVWNIAKNKENSRTKKMGGTKSVLTSRDQ